MKKTALIMAGGRGERFWPRSRADMPKQFLSLTEDGKTMIRLTVERILPLVEPENIYISTNEAYRELVIEQLPEIPVENILCEPVGRNTAPCIGLGAVHIAKKHDDAIMMVLSSDHLIRYPSMFRQSLIDGCEVAEAGENIVTIGITPSAPETGYGYIRFVPDSTLGRAYAVERFVEKPDIITAKGYLASHEYLWNSGMFIWKISTVMKNIKSFLPDMYAGLSRIGSAIGTDSYDEVLRREFSGFASVSIDYGVMEKASDIYCLAGNFGWDDVGSWLSVGRIRKCDASGNVVDGNVITVDTHDAIIQGTDRLIAAVGLHDIVIVDTKDAVLICDKEHTGDIKKVLEQLRTGSMDEYI